ncbi:MAG: phosphoenolpyruvate--protein phosphotransferase [Nitriliruptorales bacterium]|nr:phosphoenolpyruvate--protein phosphotransferase [Nitriliruptorales bacterium]
MSDQLSGTGVSPGIAVGPVVQMGLPIGELPEPTARGDAQLETQRANRALDEVARDLERRQERATGTAAEVLFAQSMMARDPVLLDAVAAEAATGRPAPHAVNAAIRGFREQLVAAGGYMAERAADLDDLRNRCIARLLHLPMPGVPDRDDPFVLVAGDLAPADTVDLDPALVVALVTERGGATSHTAIIAKAMGLPAVVTCPGITAVREETRVIVDGSTGLVTLDPADDQVAAAQRRAAARAELLESSSGPGRTLDGQRVELLLNLGSTSEADAADVDAEGVGLLRTEFLFLDRTTEPTVDEQVEAYARLFAAFGGRKVVVRTLDVGADKPLPFVEPGPGDNPALGLRGWRLGERNPGLLERQLDAIAAAAAGSQCDTWVMAPMIATVEEAAAFTDRAHAAGHATAGVMVEVPSLALRAGELMRVVDFVSIGTNDLSQYTFAADRLVGELGDLLDPWQPALLELVARTAQAGVAAHVPVGVCGEAASDPYLALVLAGVGCSSLSMARGSLPQVRVSLAGVTVQRCRDLAQIALAAPDARTARAKTAAELG